MKSILLKTIAYSLIAVSLWSCKKDEERVITNVSPAGTLTASATAIDLSIQNSAKTAVVFSFPEATVTGYPVAVTSTLQFDLKGNNFATAKEIVLDATTYETTVAELNKMMLSLGATIGTSTDVEVRLKSAPAPNAPTYSNVITLTGTPYLASAWVYVPGAYNGWLVETADSLMSLTGNGIYTGMIAFTPGNLEFKIAPKKSWDGAFGDAGGGAISSTAGNNLAAPTAGNKIVTVNLNTNTIKIEEPEGWGIIGDATALGWDGDTDMKLINDGKGIWQVTATLKTGFFKFRFKHDWAVNLGGSNGTLTDGGDNIPVAAGTYTITLNPETKTYTIVKK